MAKIAEKVCHASHGEASGLEAWLSSTEKSPQPGDTPVTKRSRCFHKARRAHAWLFTDSWAIEYVSLALASGTLASSAGILGYYHNRASAHGLQLLTLNTVLSFLSTVLKGTMMLSVASCLGQLKWVLYSRGKDRLAIFEVFDNASRGPIGAAQLLLLRYPHLPTIGCVVTLMAFASDAFVQQAISYPFTQRSPAYGPVATLWPGLMATIYDRALVSNSSRTSSSITPQRATSNCVFPRIASLAICSRCANATHLLKETSQGDLVLPNGFFLTNGSNFNASSTIASLNLLSNRPAVFIDASFLAASTHNINEYVGYECPFITDAGKVPLPPQSSLPLASNQSFSTTSRTLELLQRARNGNIQDDGNKFIWLSLKKQDIDIPQAMAQIAATMTNNIRQSDFSTTKGRARMLVGKAYTAETYIHPQWRWLLHPTAMVLLATLFCGLTIGQTMRLEVPSWNSSALAVMIHGVQGGEEHALDDSGYGGRAAEWPVSML